MFNTLTSEFLKLKKDYMFFTATAISISIPVFIIIKDRFLSVPPSELTDWIMSCCIVDFLILSALSGFIITNLVQKEYQSGTLTNILSSAVSRASFVFSKLAVWFFWYAIMLFLIEMVTIFGSRMMYPSQFHTSFAKMILMMYTKTGLLAFAASIPLLWIAILQRKLFYPSLLTALGFTGIFLGGFNISLEMILPASIIPWTAVPLVSVYQVRNPYMMIGLISVVLTGITGLLLALRSMYRQE